MDTTSLVLTFGPVRIGLVLWVCLLLVVLITMESRSVPQARMQWHNLGCNLYLLGSIKMGFCRHVGQGSLELLSSGDPPTVASQSTGITAFRMIFIKKNLILPFRTTHRGVHMVLFSIPVVT
ncbi:hypothetical protein AAY473_027310 [Plecturocebus cupreus]